DGTLDLDNLEYFDHIANANVVVVLHADTTFHAVTDFVNVIFEPLLTLPRLPVPPQPRENPFIALLAAFRFLLASPLIGGIALLG
ncbi:hypothetical protein MJI20_30625, partial [Salmonella enterica subsp. enterica serovar Anatum]|nr:hypothetical protein [Salmonella enterica subsp. enterica serovar Anatum]